MIPVEEITIFAKFEDSTKRLKISNTLSLEQLEDILLEKLPELSRSFKIQVKDQEFDMMCDLDDPCDQLYNGAKLIIKTKQRKQVVVNTTAPPIRAQQTTTNMKEESPDAILSDEVRERLQRLEEENDKLRSKIEENSERPLLIKQC